jgi:hypothetical protein
VAVNKGGLLFVSPKYLSWAKSLMTSVRASISVHVISSLGKKAQKDAYKFLLKDDKLLKEFTDKVKGIDVDEDAVIWVYENIVDYTFHARSAVEWRKYRAEKTDRTAGKDKKMGTRENLKGGKGSTDNDK